MNQIFVVLTVALIFLTEAYAGTAEFVPGDQYEAKVKALLDPNLAKTSVDVIQFNFNDATGLTQDLINLKSKHLRDPKFSVQILLEKDRFGAATANAKAIDHLASGGFAGNPSNLNSPFSYFQTVGISDQNGNTGITHTKMIMVDDHQILAGSTNWTPTSIKKNNETDLYIDSPKLGQTLKNYFNHLKENSSQLYPGFEQDGNITMLMDNTYFNTLIDFLASVRNGDSLDCSMYLFSVGDTSAPSGLFRAETIANSIIEAQGKGATVRLMLEKSSAAFGAHENMANQLAVNYLAKYNVTNVFWDNPVQISHMKFCVITRPKTTQSEAIYDIILGSTNWNYLDLDLNHQLNWRITSDDGTIGANLIRYFEKALADPSSTHAIAI